MSVRGLSRLTRMTILAVLVLFPAGARELKMHATAYADRGRTAAGRRTRRGVIAGGPRVLPLGSKVKVKGCLRRPGRRCRGIRFLSARSKLTCTAMTPNEPSTGPPRPVSMGYESGPVNLIPF